MIYSLNGGKMVLTVQIQDVQNLGSSSISYVTFIYFAKPTAGMQFVQNETRK